MNRPALILILLSLLTVIPAPRAAGEEHGEVEPLGEEQRQEGRRPDEQRPDEQRPNEHRGAGTVIVEGGEEVIHPGEAGPGEPIPAGGYLPGARTVIPLEKFRESGKSVADVLAEAPGIQVVRSGGGMDASRVRIRGSGPEQVLILLDGQPLNAETGSPAGARRENRQGVDLATLTLDRVESIEIIRGASTSLYGPRAAAGVIIIRTRGAAHPGLAAHHTVGPGGFRENAASWSGPLGESGEAVLSVSLNQRKSQGEYVFYDPAAVDSAPTPSDEAERCAPTLGGGYRLRKCNAKEALNLALRLERGRHQRWSLEAGRFISRGLGGVLDARPNGREESRRVSLAYSDALPLARGGDGKTEGDKLGWELGLTRLRAERSENDSGADAPPDNSHTERRNSAGLWREFWLEPHQFRTGGELVHQRLEDRYFAVGRDQRAAYLRWDGHLEKGGLEASVRRDWYSDVAARSTYRTGGARYLTSHFGIKASRATGYRPPALYELYDPGSPSGPSPANPALLPESSLSNDGGFFYEHESRLYGELLYYQQLVSDHIVATADPDSPSLFRFRNLHRTRSSGIESALYLRFQGGLGADMTWSTTKAIIEENQPDDPRYNGNRVPGVPEHQGSAGLSWQSRGWRAWVSQRVAGRRYIDPANSRYLRPYQLWESGITFPLPNGFSATLEGRNLTNETYAELENHPPPGREFYLTIRWRQTAPPAAGGLRPQNGQ